MVNNVNNITAANAYTYLGFLKLLLLNVVYLFPVARGTSARPSERFFRLAGFPQGRQSRPSRSRRFRKRRRRRARVFMLRHNLHIRFGFALSAPDAAGVLVDAEVVAIRKVRVYIVLQLLLDVGRFLGIGLRERS